MALKLPPQHRVDAVPIFVHPSDDAWDMDRVNRETAGMDDASSHPFVRYWSRSTRYDLHAKLPFDGQMVSAADYLDLSKALQFRLRRLGSAEMARVDALIQAADKDGVDPNEAWDLACRLSLMGTEGPEGMPRDYAELGEKAGPWYVWAVGEAAYWASIPLTEVEKKASGS